MGQLPHWRGARGSVGAEKRDGAARDSGTVLINAGCGSPYMDR